MRQWALSFRERLPDSRCHAETLTARELFGHVKVGVLPRLVHSRFGLHMVEVIEREGGVAQSFKSVRGAVATALRQQTYVAALRQYLRVLAGQAVIKGVNLEAASSPLLQSLHGGADCSSRVAVAALL